MKNSMLGNLSAIVSDTLTDSIQMIDINELHESADNFFVVENIASFAQTILGQGGVKDNLIVKPLSSGGYEIISGHRRKAAVQYLIDNGENISHYLPCLVQDYADEDDKMLDLILMNVSARQISDPELWKCYETIDRILKDKKDKGEYYGRIRDDIAKTLGVSSAQVGKMQNIDKNAIEPVKEAVAKGELSISTANEIAKLDKADQDSITDLSKVQPKDIRKRAVDTSINDVSFSMQSPVKWDGIIYADIIKKRLLGFMRADELESAKTMKNSDFSDMIRKNHRHSSSSSDGVSVTGTFDKVTIRFLSTSGISNAPEIYMSWTIAARHIRAWVQEDISESASETENKSEVDTSINEEMDTAAEKHEKLLRWAQSLTQDQINFLCDGIKGYLIEAANEASFSKEQIKSLLAAMTEAVSNLQKAEVKYINY